MITRRESRAERIARLAAEAPPLTAAQRTRIAVLLAAAVAVRSAVAA